MHTLAPLVLAFVAGAPALKETPQRDELLVGRWQLDRASFDGQDVTAQNAGLVYKITNDFQWTILDKSGTRLLHRYEIDPHATPKAVDLIVSVADGTTRRVLGIYKVEKDRLTLALAKHPAARPTTVELDQKNMTVIVMVRGSAD